MPIIIPQFDLQAEFLDVSSEDSEGEETGKDITGTDIESQNQEAKAAADVVPPVQIERRFNNLSTVSTVWMLFSCCNVGVDTYSTMHYRKVMTKLNENNVTHVIKTMTSMNYFDSNRKNLTYILNGSQDG
jgi:hypothetical protein